MLPLPASFTSLYRLFLRTSSASVLHHQAARFALHQSWRPIFEGAATVIRKLQSTPSSHVPERKVMEDWLLKWEQRMDNTLSLLYTSASSRGLPHDLTRNLASLQRRHNSWSNERRKRLGRVWNSQLSASEYLTEARRTAVTSKKRKSADDVESRAWNALGEVVRMAEGRDALTLGRVNWRNRQRIPWRQH